MLCIEKTQEKNGKVYGGYLQNQDLIGQMESEHMPGDRQVSTSYGTPQPSTTGSTIERIIACVPRSRLVTGRLLQCEFHAI